MSFLSNLLSSTNDDLPEFSNLAEGIGFLMRYLRPYSEGLVDYEFYLKKRWMEVRDDVEFQEAVLHVFKEQGEYLHIIDGDVTKGSWEHDLRGIILQFAGEHELFELVFLNENFFILKKHGNHDSKGYKSPYLFLASEKLAKNAEWPELLAIMYEFYKSNSNYKAIVFVVLLLILVIALLSVL